MPKHNVCYDPPVYFLRLKPLKEELIGQGLAEKERFKYLMAWMLLVGISSGTVSRIGDPFRSLLMMGLLLITILGVWYAYRRNGGQAGGALLDRYISIGWVVRLRVALAMRILVPLLFHFTFIQRLGEYLDYFAFTMASFFPGELYYADGGQGGLLVFFLLIAECYIALSIGKHLAEVRQGTEGGLTPFDSPHSPPASMSTPPGLLTPPGEVSPQSRQLERFVETVIQRKFADTVPPAPRTRQARQTPSRQPSRPARTRKIQKIPKL